MFNEVMKFLYDCESHDIGILVVDHNVRVTFSNKKARQLYPVSDGTQISAGTGLYSLLKLCLEQRKTRSGVPFHEPSSDRSSSFVLYAYPLTDRENNNSFLLVIILDSNPLYQHFKSQSANEKLDLIGKMAAATANVILNPLAVIKDMLQLIEQLINTHIAAKDPPISPVHYKVQGYFQTIQHEITTIDKHIQRLIALGKPAEIMLNRIEILSFLDQIVPSVRKKSLEKGLRFICEYPASDGEIFAHSVYLEDVLQALLENAAEATGQGKSVIFRTEITEQNVCFIIIDHGEGIPPELISQIGDPFVTTKGESLGLGLSYSCQIIEKMGGTLNIQSLPEGTQVQVSFTKIE